MERLFMKKVREYIVLASLFTLTGCVSGLDVGSGLSPSDSGYQSGFNTNRHSFLTPLLGATSSKNERNSFLDEFIDQSDMQCQHYLGNYQNRTQNITSSVEQSLYMSIFDTVSLIFGVKYITDTAKEVFVNNTNTSTPENQSIYQNALTPEIMRGVEIARLRYANAMKKRKNEALGSYSVANLQTDMRKYDKQCSNEFGLMEINKALRQAQNQMMRNSTVIPKIDPVEIKKKVEVATKKVKEETQKKKEQESREKNTKKDMKKEKEIKEVVKNKNI